MREFEVVFTNGMHVALWASDEVSAIMSAIYFHPRKHGNVTTWHRDIKRNNGLTPLYVTELPRADIYIPKHERVYNENSRYHNTAQQ